MKIELGAIGFSAEFKNGELVYGSPRIEILQDNMREVAAQIPNGKYQWVLTLDLESATRADVALSIQQVIDRGWVECPICASRLVVNAKGDVTRCTACGDEAPAYWNLFIQTH
jgi:hypothetical protein